MSNSGTVGILNVGAGDTKLSFDRSNPAECIRAARIVRDMLRRGYALLVEITQPDGTKAYQRALDFREDTAEYIVADFDPLSEQRAPELPATAIPPEGWKPRTSLDDGPILGANHEEASEAATDRAATPAPEAPTARRRGRARKAIPAASTRAVAVARTAGG